ncbi:retrovirus-related Pol polyprotein from transposon RE1 [Trichonephila clavipes]|uniref:Retrovirus-related Pol polyprotein from transposon RE1 n=1 Tax=Trichonephila clavipes TaxID=2585209 RepID=A0A8X6RJX6_TRICX|nr:retrovirus-related Pol polyprotein from transposon RE1 [Trichonephila clavipes]
MEFNNKISVLTPNNWNTWKHDMQVLLMHYGCWQFIIQTKPEQPDEEATYKEKLDLQLHQFFGTKYQPEEDVGIFISRVKTAATRLQEAGHKLDDLYIGFQLIRWLPQEFQSTVQQIYRWKEEDFRVVKIEAELILEANRLQLMKQDLEKAENAYLSSFTSKKSKTLPGATAAAHGDPNGKNDYQKRSGKVFNCKTIKNVKQSIKTIGPCYVCNKYGHLKVNCKEKKSLQKSPSTVNETFNTEFNINLRFCEAECSLLELDKQLVTSCILFEENFDKGLWVIDTAATSHFCNDKSLFLDLKPITNMKMSLATEDKSCPVEGIGTLRFRVKYKGSLHEITLTDVLFNPKLRRNLLSGSRLESKGAHFVGTKDGIKTLFKSSEVPHKFWGEALLCFTYEWNRICHKDSNKTPFEKYSGRKPSVLHLKPFGCLAYAGVPKQIRKKFDMRAKMGIMMGYAQRTKGYRIWLIDENKLVETINVRFDENKRGINFRQKVNSNLGYNLNLPDYYDDEDDSDRVKDSLTSRLVSKTSTETPSTSENPDVSSDNHSLIPCTEVKWIRNIGRKVTGSNVYYSIEGEATRLKSFNEIERYCKRHNIEYDPSLFNFRKDNTESQGFSDLSEQQEALMVEVTIPNCYKQAIRSRDASKWHDAMDKEINVMKERKVWDLVDHPDTIKILENRWVYTIKYNENNKIVRYKARLVARGNTQLRARRRFVEWAQNEIAIVRDFHKRILFSDEAHFWLNGYVNKQNCRIWSEANQQVYVETPLYAEKLTVWCALWACVIIDPYFFKIDEGHNVTVNGDRYRAMITNFFIPELNNHDVQELWFQQDGATCHTARATIDLLKDTFGDRLISRLDL